MKFFLIDFNQNTYIEDVSNLKDVLISFPSFTNAPPFKTKKCKITSKHPVAFSRYQKAFNMVIDEIKNGNTYLLNLTFPSSITTECSLKEIFYAAKAPYKLLFKEKFVCFSPERFVNIKNGTIFTYPMKGTIDASVSDAKNKILSDIKEKAEHTMVVDLLRNDLGIVGTKVRVNRFRYVDKIKAGGRELLQVSSEIEAKLPKNWHANWLSIIKNMLPAGSVTGTPKKKTVEIIKKAENYNRGFYTGVFGITDEKTFLESAVIIRYIEKTENGLVYKSGGGITIDSDVKKEYEELVKKIYIPI